MRGWAVTSWVLLELLIYSNIYLKIHYKVFQLLFNKEKHFSFDSIGYGSNN